MAGQGRRVQSSCLGVSRDEDVEGARAVSSEGFQDGLGELGEKAGPIQRDCQELVEEDHVEVRGGAQRVQCRGPAGDVGGVHETS